MDLLGSILGKMDAPPLTAVDKEALKKAKGLDLPLLLYTQRHILSISFPSSI